jgi:hypothetical protein
MPPDPMTGFSPRPLETLIVALCTVCARKGVSNLLNHTPLAGRPVAARYLARCDGTRLDLGRLRRCCYYDRYTHICHRDTTVSNVTRAHRHVQYRSTLLAVSPLLFTVEVTWVKCKSMKMWHDHACMHLWYKSYTCGANTEPMQPCKCNHHIPSSIMLALSKVVRRTTLEIPGKIPLFFFWKFQIQIQIRISTQYKNLLQNIFK